MPRSVAKEFKLSVPPFFKKNLKFGKDENALYADILNNILVNNGIRISDNEGLEVLKRLNDLIDNESFRDEENQLIRCKIGRLFIFLSAAVFEEEVEDEEIDELIENLDEISDKDSEFWWYYGYLLFIRATRNNNFDNDFFAETLFCIENLNEKTYKIGLISLLLREFHGERSGGRLYSEYINPVTIEKLGAQFKEYEDYLCAEFSVMNHDYVIYKYLYNHIFYDLQKSEKRILKDCGKKTYLLLLSHR